MNRFKIYSKIRIPFFDNDYFISGAYSNFTVQHLLLSYTDQELDYSSRPISPKKDSLITSAKYLYDNEYWDLKVHFESMFENIKNQFILK